MTARERALAAGLRRSLALAYLAKVQSEPTRDDLVKIDRAISQVADAAARFAFAKPGQVH
jgi:hypothetical protein